MRTVPEHSTLEIAALKDQLRSELSARAYFFEKKGFIVSTVSGIAETGEPTILSSDVANIDLGRCVCAHLLRFSPKSPPNMRSMKSTDWPAYRASGAKSVRSFESASWMILIDTVNSAITITSRPRLSLHPEISVEGMTNPSHEDVGVTVLKTLRAAMSLRDSGLI